MEARSTNNVHTLEVALLFAKPCPAGMARAATPPNRASSSHNGERDSIKPGLEDLVGRAEEPEERACCDDGATCDRGAQAVTDVTVPFYLRRARTTKARVEHRLGRRR